MNNTLQESLVRLPLDHSSAADEERTPFAWNSQSPAKCLVDFRCGVAYCFRSSRYDQRL